MVGLLPRRYCSGACRPINSVNQNRAAEDFCFAFELLAESFSDANRRRVIRMDTTDDVVLIKFCKSIIQRAAGAFRRIAFAPALSRERPTELEAGPAYRI